MKELRQAAERVIGACETLCGVGSPYSIDDLRKGKLKDDELKIAEFVLSQCDADGDEPVTSELMQRLGAKPNHWPAGTVDWSIPADGCDVIVRIWREEIKSLPDLILSNCGDDGDFQWPIENVRHLRKALEFLGIKTTTPREKT